MTACRGTVGVRVRLFPPLSRTARPMPGLCEPSKRRLDQSFRFTVHAARTLRGPHSSSSYLGLVILRGLRPGWRGGTFALARPYSRLRMVTAGDKASPRVVVRLIRSRRVGSDLVLAAVLFDRSLGKPRVDAPGGRVSAEGAAEEQNVRLGPASAGPAAAEVWKRTNCQGRWRPLVAVKRGTCRLMRRKAAQGPAARAYTSTLAVTHLTCGWHSAPSRTTG